MPALLFPLLALLAGSLVYSGLAMVAARRYASVPAPDTPTEYPPITITTPLAGADLGLEHNLRSSFAQDYPRFELVFAVRRDDDPACAVVRRLMAEFPHVAARLLIVGDPVCPNAKVHSLKKMTGAAAYDLLVMKDSDIRSDPGMLRTVAAEFADPRVGLATCPYVAISGPRWAARLEALMMNTHFMAGVLTARMLEGMKFALGPSAAVRRGALEAIGGWDALDRYLAEDFMLGKLVAESGAGVILSRAVVEHHIGSASWSESMEHRLRWCRSTRRSRPWGYVGEVFTNPIPLALLVTAASPIWWPALALTVAMRYASSWAVARALRSPAAVRDFWAVPLQDLFTLLAWVGGFVGNRITWRGRIYELYRDGRFELVQE